MAIDDLSKAIPTGKEGGIVDKTGMSPDGRTRKFLARNNKGLSPMGHNEKLRPWAIMRN